MYTKTLPHPKGESQNDRTVKSSKTDPRFVDALPCHQYQVPPSHSPLQCPSGMHLHQCTAPHPLAKLYIQERLVHVVCRKTKGKTPPQFLKSSQLNLTQPSMANRMLLPPHVSFHLKTMPKSLILYEMLPVRTDFDCDSDHSSDSRDHIKPSQM